jgi:hypothetical protein
VPGPNAISRVGQAGRLFGLPDIACMPHALQPSGYSGIHLKSFHIFFRVFRVFRGQKYFDNKYVVFITFVGLV